MKSLNVFLLAVAAISSAMGQEVFHSYRTTSFEVRHQPGIPEDAARKVSDYLEQDYGYLRQLTGLNFGSSLEVKIYDTEQKFAKAIGDRNASKGAAFKRGVIHVKPVGRLIAENRLAEVLSYSLALALLDQARQLGCPQWLVQSFAVYHSGMMANLVPPTGRKVGYFSDLDQDIQAFPHPPKRLEVEFLLGTTMKYFVEKHGETKSFQVFRRFDGGTSLDDVFQTSFGVEFTVVEESWASYLADAVGEFPSGGRKKE